MSPELKPGPESPDQIELEFNIQGFRLPLGSKEQNVTLSCS